MRIRRLAVAALSLAALAATAADARPRESKDQWRSTGETRTCIALNRINGTRIWDDSTIDFRVGAQTWRNTLPRRCPQLGFERRYAFKTSTSQICSVDTITVLSSAGPGLMAGATCGLGRFERVSKPGR